MESILSEQSATVDELVEACIQAFGWSFERYFFIVLFQMKLIVIEMYGVVHIGDQAMTHTLTAKTDDSR